MSSYQQHTLKQGTQIENVSGTAGQKPSNDSTWKGQHERTTGDKFGQCSRQGCNEKATGGAHVNVQGKCKEFP